MFILFLVFAAGAMVYALITFLVMIMIWMFTTVVGLVIVCLFVFMVIINLLTPEGDEEDEDDTP